MTATLPARTETRTVHDGKGKSLVTNLYFSEALDIVGASSKYTNDKPGGFVSGLVDSARRYGATPARDYWLCKLAAEIVSGNPSNREMVDIGDMKGIASLFSNAHGKLKHPKIHFGFGDMPITLSVATSRARFPGTINVTDDGSYGDRNWYGRIHHDGKFERSNCCPDNVVVFLRKFSVNPAEVAASYGKSTGNCCFCNRKLTDERSTYVGYGPVCAEHYSLPYGERPAKLALLQDVSEDSIYTAEAANEPVPF